MPEFVTIWGYWGSDAAAVLGARRCQILVGICQGVDEGVCKRSDVTHVAVVEAVGRIARTVIAARIRRP